MECVDVYLVHGTFAPDAEWTGEGSLLRKAIERELPNARVKFHSPQWTGRNSHCDRIEAGNELVKELTQHATSGGTACFVIGHSHGGTVVGHAMRQSPELCKLVDGFVLMSTPVIHAKMRAGSQFVVNGLEKVLDVGMALLPLIYYFGALMLSRKIGVEFPPAIYFYTLIFFCIGLAIRDSIWYGDGWCDIKYEFTCWWREWGFLIVGNTSGVVTWILIDYGAVSTFSKWLVSSIATFIIGFAWIKLGPRNPAHAPREYKSTPRVLKKAENLVNELAWPQIDPSRVIFVRGGRDEASGALTYIHLTKKIWDLLASIPYRLFLYANPFEWHENTRAMRLREKNLYLFLLLLLWAPVVGALISLFAVIGFHILSKLTTTDYSGVITALDGATDVFTATSVVQMANQATGGLFLVVLLIFFAGLLGQMPFTRAFGAWFAFYGALVELSVEAVPPGNWTLYQVKPDDTQRPESLEHRGVSLEHSVYLNPHACKVISDWIALRVNERRKRVGRSNTDGDVQELPSECNARLLR